MTAGNAELRFLQKMYIFSSPDRLNHFNDLEIHARKLYPTLRRIQIKMYAPFLLILLYLFPHSTYIPLFSIAFTSAVCGRM
jgi:hypothetical protein